MRLFVLFMIGSCLILSGAYVPKVIAVSVSILEASTSVDQNQESDISLRFDCVNCTSDSYLRAVFYTTGSSNYFGYTLASENNWVNAPGGSCTKYFPITSGMLKEGSWSGMLRIKPDSESSYFNGPGEYQFKIGRYTSSCSSPTWSSEKTIAITGPTHTPTPTITPTNSITPTSSHTPTHTPSPIATVTPSPTTTVNVTLVPKKSPTPIEYTIDDDSMEIGTPSGEVKGASDEIMDPLFTTVATPSSRIQTKSLVIATLLIAMGFGLLSGVYAWMIHGRLLKIEE